MTQPDEHPPIVGTGESADEHSPETAEEYAESVPIDPSPDEVRHYQELIGDIPPDLPEGPSTG